MIPICPSPVPELGFGVFASRTTFISETLPAAHAASAAVPFEPPVALPTAYPTVSVTVIPNTAGPLAFVQKTPKSRPCAPPAKPASTIV